MQRNIRKHKLNDGWQHLKGGISNDRILGKEKMVRSYGLVTKYYIVKMAYFVTMYLCPGLSLEVPLKKSLTIKIFPAVLLLVSFENAWRLDAIVLSFYLFSFLLRSSLHTHFPIYLQEPLIQRRIKLKWFTWISLYFAKKEVKTRHTGYSTVRATFLMSFAYSIFCFVPVNWPFSLLRYLRFGIWWHSVNERKRNDKWLYPYDAD